MPALPAIGAIAAIGSATAAIAGAFKKAPKAPDMSSPQVDAGSTSQMDNLGRAALISTSPQGVEGTNPSLRYKLLGNAPGLGN